MPKSWAKSVPNGSLRQTQQLLSRQLRPVSPVKKRLVRVELSVAVALASAVAVELLVSVANEANAVAVVSVVVGAVAASSC